MNSQEVFELTKSVVESIYQDQPTISGDSASLFFEDTLGGQQNNETFWMDKNATSQLGSQN